MKQDQSAAIAKQSQNKRALGNKNVIFKINEKIREIVGHISRRYHF